MNADGEADLSDAVSVFGFLFLGGDEPACADGADVNDDGSRDLSDGVFLLSHLFRGGPAPPPPGARCPGPDPTPDALDCLEGAGTRSPLPEADIFAAAANAPGVRQRSRVLLPRDAPEDGSVPAFFLPQGRSFAVVVEARRNTASRAGFSLAHPDDPRRGNPAALEVTADRDLGDPAAGGVPAGGNLAAWFLRDVDLWRDGIYLLEQASLRVPGTAPWSPAEGICRLTATVTDVDGCVSAPVSLLLVVEAAPSDAPRDALLWVEEGPEVLGVPLQHHPGSGNARLVEGRTALLVVDVPGATPEAMDGLRIVADAPLPDGSDLTGSFRPVTETRRAMTLEPATFPPLGNTTVEVRVEGTERPIGSIVLEVPVSYAGEIQRLWDVNCTGCHEGPDADRGLELVGPEPSRVRRNIVNVFAAEPEIDSPAAILVRPYLPERSYLFHKLRGTHLGADVRGSGQRMPLGGGFLDDGAMRLIEGWILQGAE